MPTAFDEEKQKKELEAKRREARCSWEMAQQQPTVPTVLEAPPQQSTRQCFRDSNRFVVETKRSSYDCAAFSLPTSCALPCSALRQQDISGVFH